MPAYRKSDRLRVPFRPDESRRHRLRADSASGPRQAQPRLRHLRMDNDAAATRQKCKPQENARHADLTMSTVVIVATSSTAALWAKTPAAGLCLEPFSWLLGRGSGARQRAIQKAAGSQVVGLC